MPGRLALGRARSAPACSSAWTASWPPASVSCLPSRRSFASGLFELPDAFKPVSEGMSATGLQLVVSVVIAFVVGLAAIAWLLRFVMHHSMYWFVGYRVVLGVGGDRALLGTGVVAAT